ncbi:MAG: Asp-tRNA(Asn)/Glu-tRNA(Gln) amidotransferase subunit GatC [Patescibacteria group bacterium]
MKIDKSQIDHLAKLSRLELSVKDQTKFVKNLNDILGYVEQLNQVDTKEITTTTQIAGLKNVWRDDVVEPTDETSKNEIKNNIPAMEDDYLKVKRVL